MMANYRPDVDGLRAIAILFALFFHGGLKLFSSGFIGVDIFFVISGFLITSIIHESLQNNTFSLFEFYSRRLWRMQPVLISLLVVTTLLTLLFYLPDDLLQYGRSVRKASLFTSNQFFARTTTGYFADDLFQLPLLHTWSLSVEWQYYLIFPLVLYLLCRLFTKERLIKIILLLTLVFFAIALYYSSHDPTKTYYQLVSRIFEFLVGSMVALNPYRLSLNRYFLNLMSLVALLALFYIATDLRINQGYPNGYALVPCLATGILIACGQHHPTLLATRFLSLRPMVFIGLISYSLYLWHWPVWAMLRYFEFTETTTLRLLAFGLIFIIAFLSWRWIEKPARKLNTTKFGYSFLWLFLLPLAVFHLSTSIIHQQEGYPGRFAEASRIYRLLNSYASPQRKSCLQQQNTAIDPHCVLGAKGRNSQTALMIGDSFSNHLWRFMDFLAKEAKVSILAHATASCLCLPGIAQYGWHIKDQIYEKCREQTARYYQMIQSNHYDFVIIGQSWDIYPSDKIINQINDKRSHGLAEERIEKALDKALEIIIASGAKPVLLKETAYAKNNAYACFFQHIKQRKNYNPRRCDFTFSPNHEKWVNHLLLKMKKKYSQLVLIDPKKVQCRNGLCQADIKGIPVFRDAVHINDYAAYQFAKRYLKRYKNPL